MRVHPGAAFGAGVAAAVLFVHAGVAPAADGGAVLIGRANVGSLTTSLGNGSGTALSLSSRPGTPPLRVNSPARVVNLNADLLDGVDSSQLALAAGRTGIVIGSADDDGYVNTARCPAGTVATGGGGVASGVRDALTYSGPDYTASRRLVPNSWFVAAASDAVAWVVCYNPRGPVPGAAAAAPDVLARGGTTRPRFAGRSGAYQKRPADG